MSLAERVDRAVADGRPERAWEDAAAAWSDGDRADRHHAGQVLRWLAPRLPEAAWTEARRALARRVGATGSPPPAIPGRVAFPAVGGSGSRFVVARVEASPSDDLPDLDRRTEAAVRAALDAARALRRRPDGLRVRFDAGGWEGSSCGLAVALAALSALDGVPVSPLVAASGAVDPAGRLQDVGADAGKADLRRQARPRARLLVPPTWSADEPALVPVADLEAAAAAALEAGDDPDPALARVRDHDRAGRWLEAAREAEALVDHPGLDEAERQRLVVLLLLAANHGADPEARARWEARLDLARLAGRDLEAWVRAVGSRIVGYVDALDPVAAREVLGLTAAVALPPELEVHRRGPAALLATLEGRPADALALREASVAGASADERPRCLGDLSDALLRAGRPAEALAAADAGLEAADAHRRRRPYLVRTRAYLALHRGRALLALGRAEEAVTVVDAATHLPGPDPRFRLALLEAEARRESGLASRAFSALPAALQRVPLLQLLTWRTLWHLGRPELLAPPPEVPAFSGLSAEQVAARVPY